jgi:hypothetical protein
VNLRIFFLHLIWCVCCRVNSIQIMANSISLIHCAFLPILPLTLAASPAGRRLVLARPGPRPGLLHCWWSSMARAAIRWRLGSATPHPLHSSIQGWSFFLPPSPSPPLLCPLFGPVTNAVGQLKPQSNSFNHFSTLISCLPGNQHSWFAELILSDSSILISLLHFQASFTSFTLFGVKTIRTNNPNKKPLGLPVRKREFGSNESRLATLDLGQEMQASGLHRKLHILGRQF